ncbi:MAG: amidohydrolase family protein [Christensenellales bacterium]
MKHDYSKLLIKNGRIFDPSRNIDDIGDIAIHHNLIVPVFDDGDTADLRVIDAKGYYVFPGLIDFHTHLDFSGSEVGLQPDLMLIPNGVTSAVDAGTCGIANYENLARHIIPTNLVTIKSLLYIANAGQISETAIDNIDPDYFDEKSIRFFFDKYSSQLIGLKIRISQQHVRNMGLRPLVEAIALAGRVGCPLSVHVVDPPCEYDAILPLLRKGDILVHPYQGRGNTIVDRSGKIYKELFEAKKRGVIFDLAGARYNYNMQIAKTAIREGLLPDVFSTDVVKSSIYEKPVFALPYIMSLYLSLGITLRDVITGVTSAPAKLMGLQEQIGTLAPGYRADITIMQLKKTEVVFHDMYGNSNEGGYLFIPQATIKNGRILYKTIEL